MKKYQGSGNIKSNKYIRIFLTLIIILAIVVAVILHIRGEKPGSGSGGYDGTDAGEEFTGEHETAFSEAAYDVTIDGESEDVQDELTEVQDDLGDIKERYTDDDTGYIPESSYSNALDEVEEYLEEKLADGTVLGYEMGDGAVYIKFSSGLTFMFDLSSNDVSSIRSYKREAPA